MNSNQMIYRCPLCGNYLDKTVKHDEYYDRCLHKRVISHLETWDCRNVACKEEFADDNGRPMIMQTPFCSKSILQQFNGRWICAYVNREKALHKPKCPNFKEECMKYTYLDRGGKPDFDNLI